MFKRLIEQLTKRDARGYGRAATERTPAVPSDSARAAFRAALGQEFLAKNHRLLTDLRRSDSGGPRIRLHPRTALHDFQSGWWQTPAVRTYAVTAIELERLDLTSAPAIGRRGRRLVLRIDQALQELDEFRSFLSAFDAETPPGLLGELLLEFTLVSRWQVVAYTSEDVSQARTAARRSGEASVRVDNIQALLDHANVVHGDSPPSPEEIVAFTIGARPERGAGSYGQLIQGFGRDREELARLTLSQLGHMMRPEEFPEGVGATWLAQACILLLQTHPLLAHRAGHLALTHFRRAANVDAPATAEMLHRFHYAEVGRITSRGDRAGELIDEFHETRDDEFLVRAYATLIEGPFRSYASSLLNLWSIENGTGLLPPGPKPLLGELEDRLRASNNELARLLTVGISRDIRNAVAHEDVVRTATGLLAIIQHDGTFVEIDLEAVHEDLVMLHSALRGLDVAFGIGQWLFGDSADFNPQALQRTAESLQGLAGQAAANITGGWITSFGVSDGTLRITLDGIGGPMMPIQVLSFVASLDPHMPAEITEVEIRSQNDLPLYTGKRLPFDLFPEQPGEHQAREGGCEGNAVKANDHCHKP